MRTIPKAATTILPLAFIAADAMRFSRQQNRRLEQRSKGLEGITAYLDDNPGGLCDLKGCTSNSIDSTCKKLACQARDLGCNGDYASGKCKDIKELHDAGMCELAKKGCGDTLPRDGFPRCVHWWSYKCRVRPILTSVGLRA